MLARLDPSLLRGAARPGAGEPGRGAGQRRARARRRVEDARQKYARAQSSSAEQLLPQSDLETAQATYDERRGRSSRPARPRSPRPRPTCSQAQVDMDAHRHPAPIDGVVVARNVDVGPDGGRLAPGARALRDRQRPEPHAGERLHRRGRHRPRARGPGGRRSAWTPSPNEVFTGTRRAGAAAADHRPERRHLQRRSSPSTTPASGSCPA